MHARTNRTAAVARFVARLRDELAPHIADIRLFGSEARGDSTAESDIDVLVVVVPDIQRVTLEDRIIDLAFDINLEFGVYISPRVVTQSMLDDPVRRETPYSKNLARESIPL